MPKFDQHCLACDWQGEVLTAPFEMPPCPACGSATERLWITAAKALKDEIPGGQIIENLGPQPMKFYSQSEIVKEAKRRGLEPMVRHVPIPGTDKSPHTTSWAAVGPYQMEQARLLLERVGTSTVTPPPPPTVEPEATPDLVADLWQTLSH
jgi:hypothetical protein